jgi:hypothetical protein
MQFRKWIRFVKDKHKELERVLEVNRAAGRDCLMRLQATSFWEWKSGSQPMFWSFPDNQQVTMGEGIILWMKGQMDPWISLQQLRPDPADIPKVIKKL